jgi:hypothetical protein
MAAARQAARVVLPSAAHQAQHRVAVAAATNNNTNYSAAGLPSAAAGPPPVAQALQPVLAIAPEDIQDARQVIFAPQAQARELIVPMGLAPIVSENFDNLKKLDTGGISSSTQLNPNIHPSPLIVI